MFDNVGYECENSLDLNKIYFEGKLCKRFNIHAIMGEYKYVVMKFLGNGGAALKCIHKHELHPDE